MLPVVTYGCQESDVVQQGVRNSMTKGDVMLKKATFAAGCFWCTEADFEKLPGVVRVISGYTGGSISNFVELGDRQAGIQKC